MKLLPFWQNPSNQCGFSLYGRYHPPPFPLTLPYQSCVVERSEWRLCICGPPTQGWVSIFRASFGGDRQHGAGDGGQNVGTDGKMYFFMASWTPEVMSIAPILREAPRVDSTAGMGWSGLSGEVEEKGGGGPEIRGRAWNYRYILPRMACIVVVGLINKSYMSTSSKCKTCCFGCGGRQRGK